MLYPHKKLDELAQEMKSFGTFLMPYGFPRTSQEYENDVNFLKTRDVHVDGYNLILHYNKADHETYILETLQVLSKHCPFLPFNLVCKVGKAFLGSDNLSLVEIFRDNRKIYCWNRLSDHEGNTLPGPQQMQDMESRIYEGLSYRLMDPHQVNFY